MAKSKSKSAKIKNYLNIHFKARDVVGFYLIDKKVYVELWNHWRSGQRIAVRFPIFGVDVHWDTSLGVSVGILGFSILFRVFNVLKRK